MKYGPAISDLICSLMGALAVWWVAGFVTDMQWLRLGAAAVMLVLALSLRPHPFVDLFRPTRLLFILACLGLAGCDSLERSISPQGMTYEEMNPSYVIHDTVDGNYLMRGDKWGEKRKARRFDKKAAKAWLDAFTENEEGKPSDDTGIKIERAP